MKTNFGKNKIGNTKVPVTAITEEEGKKTETHFVSIGKAAKKLGLIPATNGKILDTREKNKYYKNTYSKEGKKFTFKKHDKSHELAS